MVHSPDTPKDDTACAFLSLILPQEGPYAAFIVKKDATRKYVDFASSIQELWHIIQVADTAGHTAYHACASYKEARYDPKGTPPAQRRYGRTKHNARCARAFWLDVDAGSDKPYSDWNAAARAVEQFCQTTGLPRPVIVLSGAGTHVYWPLVETLLPEIWQRYAFGLKTLCKKYGLQADPVRTADITSVLRTPGTHHRKSGTRLVQCSKLVGPYDLTQFEFLLSVSSDASNPTSDGPRSIEDELGPLPPHLKSRPRPYEGVNERLFRNLSKTFEPSFAEPIAERCEQIRALRDSKGKISEPKWYACLGVLAFAEDGEQLAHEWSSGDERYTIEETRERLDRARQLSGATTCTRFHQLDSEVCERCAWWGKIKSPIVLGHKPRQPQCESTDDQQEDQTEQQRKENQTNQRNQQDDRGQSQQRENGTNHGEQSGQTEEDENCAKPKQVSATPFRVFDFAKIPPRQWLYGRHYVRKYVTATVAPGGLAKSALKLVEAISMAIGRDLLEAGKPIKRSRVWYWNGEDHLEEINRRIAAICLRYSSALDQQELQKWLFIDSGHEMPICLAIENRGAVVKINREIIDAINETVERNEIDAVILDPFVSVHKVSENNNPLIDQVIKLLGRIANRNNCAIEIVHHVRKPAHGQYEITADDTRGGGAIVNAVRSCQVLNRMTKQEAEGARITEDERFRFFRVDSGKQNLAPPQKTKWRYLESIDLPNGDNVQVVEHWQYPEKVVAATQEEMELILSIAVEGVYNRWNSRSKAWIGRALADRLGLDPEDKADKQDIYAKLNACRKSGMIVVEGRQDSKRRVREFVLPGPGKDQGATPNRGPGHGATG
jgi:hypothetical protein